MNTAKEIAAEIKARSSKARNLSSDYQHFRDKRLAACRSALAFTRKVDWKIRLDVINELLGLHGTEAINGEWQNGYWCSIVATYCNTGDTYSLTVMHVRGATRWDERGKFIVCSWGDWVERYGEKFGVE